MVAEVVLSVMGNRSDRRFPNLSCAWALEAAEVTRRRRADFHQGQERTMMLLKQAEYMAATASPSTRQSPFARGWVHIRHRCELTRLNPHSSHTPIGNSNVLSRALREIEAPAVTKGASIIDAHRYRVACVRIGHLDGRAHRHIARCCRKAVGIIRLAARDLPLAKSAVKPGLHQLGQDHLTHQYDRQEQPVQGWQWDKSERASQGRSGQPGAYRDYDDRNQTDHLVELPGWNANDAFR